MRNQTGKHERKKRGEKHEKWKVQGLGNADIRKNI